MIAIASALLYEWIILLWNMLSVPLYLTTIYIIIKHSKVTPFKSAFFKLYISAGVADLLVNASFYNLLCFRIWGWMDWKPLFYHSTLSCWFRVTPYVCCWFTTIAQINGVAMLAINRFFAIIYLQEWTIQMAIYSIVCQWSIGSVGAAPFLFVNYTVEEVNGTGGEVLHSRPPRKFYAAYVMLVGVIYFSIIAIFIAFLYAAMFYHVNQKNRKIKKSKISRTSHGRFKMMRADIRLAMMGFVLFILLSVYCLLFAFYAYFTHAGNKQMKHLINILFYNQSIIQSQINPWLLIICSKAVRQRFLKLFGFKSNVVVDIAKPNQTPKIHRRSMRQNRRVYAESVL